MGRRKKEPAEVHCKSIAEAASRLFSQNGIQATTMDAIAKEAGYSKATLYVYFSNKQDLVDALILKGMASLLVCIREAVSQDGTAKEKYMRMCLALMRYQEREPFYFDLTLGEIQAGMDERDATPTQKKIYEIGESVNQEILRYLHDGIKRGELDPETENLQTVFLFWAALSGLIQMAAKKQIYFEKRFGQAKRDFLQRGFEQLYRLIAKEDLHQ